MDYNTSKEKDLIVDLESGGTSSEEDANNEPTSGNRRGKKLLNRLASGLLGFDKGESSTKSCSKLRTSSEISHETIELLIDKNYGGQSGESMKEKRKTTNSKKASRPPRPPKAPSLDVADLMFIKEITEVARKKHATIERIKAQKKIKAAKSSSSSNSILSAMIITLLFFLVIIFQGIYSRDDSGTTFHGSPEPSAATNSLISVQFYNSLLPNEGITWSSESPDSVAQASGSELASPG